MSIECIFGYPRLSTARTNSSIGNTKQVKQICFTCNEIRPCDSNACNEGDLEVCGFISAGNRLMNDANAIVETKIVYLFTENVKIWM